MVDLDLNERRLPPSFDDTYSRNEDKKRLSTATCAEGVDAKGLNGQSVMDSARVDPLLDSPAAIAAISRCCTPSPSMRSFWPQVQDQASPLDTCRSLDPSRVVSQSLCASAPSILNT